MFANHLGQFTYSVPADWNAESCEDSDVGYVVALYPGSLPCGIGEYESAWLFVISSAGDQRSSHTWRGRLVSETPVVVDGLHGVRYLSHIDGTTPLPPPQGSDEVLYLFFDGTRTYAFTYDHWPNQPDRTADFDRSVQANLKFSA